MPLNIRNPYRALHSKKNVIVFEDNNLVRIKKTWVLLYLKKLRISLIHKNYFNYINFLYITLHQGKLIEYLMNLYFSENEVL